MTISTTSFVTKTVEREGLYPRPPWSKKMTDTSIPIADGGERPRNEHGQFADRKDPETILDVFAARTDPCEPLDAGDIADELGWARRTALKKLDELADRDVLADKKVGARGRVWWIPHASTTDTSARASDERDERNEEKKPIRENGPHPRPSDNA